MTSSTRFEDRRAAGKKLAEALLAYKGKDVVVFALPRGGVVPGLEVARALGAPLDLAIARKVGAQGDEEYAIAAVAEDGDMVAEEREAARVDQAWFKAACEEQRREAKRRRETYLGGRRAVSAEGKIAIVVDDGIATGLTMRAILREVRHRKPAKIIVAVPVAPPEVIEALRGEADEIVVLAPDLAWGAIGGAYDSFPQVSDDEVRTMMKDAPL